MRKQLSAEMGVEQLELNYFTVMELKSFCHTHGIHLSSEDRKCDIGQKVKLFLETGVSRKTPKPAADVDPENKSSRVLDDQQIIGVGFKFTRAARQYFEETLDSKFKCSVPLHAWVKANPEKKICDLKDQYLELKQFRGKRAIGKLFEYNRFTRDFFSANPELSRDECLKCWHKVRELEDRNYSDWHREFLD